VYRESLAGAVCQLRVITGRGPCAQMRRSELTSVRAQAYIRDDPIGVTYRGIMRNVILTALALAVVLWYARHRKRFVRAREYARKETERWENEGGASATNSASEAA